MVTVPSPDTKLRARSPAYPAFSLPAALELARKLWNAQRKQEAHLDSALKSLGYSARSGTALRVIAGLSHYGLIDETGATRDDRKISLSERAQDIIHLAETDPRRRAALKEAALAPVIYTALWDRYGAQLPDDPAIKPFLIRDKGYNDAVVDDLLSDYRATVEFAKPDKSDDNVPNEEDRDKAAVNTQTVDKRGSQGGLQSMTLDQELPILVGGNRVARIPFPMTDDDFDLLIGTLNLWKKKLLAPRESEKPKEKEE